MAQLRTIQVPPSQIKQLSTTQKYEPVEQQFKPVPTEYASNPAHTNFIPRTLEVPIT